MKFVLEDGLKIGEGDAQKTLFDVELKSLCAADLFAAQEAAETLKITPNGSVELMMSNVRLGREILRRAIKNIGDIQGPISEAMLGKLTAKDYNLLISMHNVFEYAHGEKTAKTVAEIEKKGK